MAVGDIWEFTLRGSLLGQDILNVFGYEVTVDLGSGVTGNELGRWFWNVFDGIIQPLAVDDLVYAQVDVMQITGGAGIGSYTISNGAGTDVNQPLPSFVCATWRLNRASSLSRHGYKRFAGVSEDKSNGNTSNYSATPVNDMSDALLADVVDDTSSEVGTLTPRIISRVVNGQPRPTPIAFPISSVTFIGITSQNSRKQ